MLLRGLLEMSHSPLKRLYKGESYSYLYRQARIIMWIGKRRDKEIIPSSTWVRSDIILEMGHSYRQARIITKSMWDKI